MKRALNRLGRGVVRPFAFLPKEGVQIIRQPRLILTLIVAPFLVLLLFGVGYSGSAPPLETVLVIPPELGLPTDRVQYEDDFVSPFVLVDVTSDREATIERVRRQEIDVAVVLPADAVESVGNGEQAEIQLVYNELVPFQVDWLGFYSRVQTSEINRQVLVTVLENSQENAAFDLDQLLGYNESLDQQQAQLDQQLAGGEREAALATVQSMRRETASTMSSTAQAAAFLAAISLSLGATDGAPPADQISSLDDANTRLTEIDAALANIEQALQSDDDVSSDAVSSDMQRVRDGQSGLAALGEQLRAIPAEVLVSPFKSAEVNLAPTEPGFVAFYSPAVLALLVQHIAVTLTALTLVRERLRGTLEYFRVAPLSAGEMLVGKYVAYFLQSCILAAILVALVIFSLDVPMEGDWWFFAGALALLIIASMGVGLFISAISRTETQAVQLAMLVLLASVFFSGFFLPLDNLSDVVLGISYALPVTYGIASFQELMLRGDLPATWMLVAPAALAAGLFSLAWIALRRQFRRV